MELRSLLTFDTGKRGEIEAKIQCPVSLVSGHWEGTKRLPYVFFEENKRELDTQTECAID